MHNVHKFYVEKILRDKKELLSMFKKAFFCKLKLPSNYASWFDQSTKLLFWRVVFFLRKNYARYPYKTILGVQGISEFKLEHHTTSRNYYTTRESDFCQI